MSNFTDFKRCLVELDGIQIYATSASLSMNTSLARDTRFEGWDSDSAGALINDPTLTPTAGVVGTLSFDFVVSQQHFSMEPTVYRNTSSGNEITPEAWAALPAAEQDNYSPENYENNIESIFDLNRQMSPELARVGRIGNYRFFNAGLKDFSFQMQPFSLVEAKAEYEVFGSVIEVADKGLPVDLIDPAEGLKSFGDLSANGINLQNKEEFNVQLISADYRVSAKRKYNYTIRANEHPVSKFVPGAMMPYRVSLSELEVTCSIKSNKIVSNLNEYGNMQSSADSFDVRRMELGLNLYQARGSEAGPKHLAEFKCMGAVTDQRIEVGEGSYLYGNFTVKQVLK